MRIMIVAPRPIPKHTAGSDKWQTTRGNGRKGSEPQALRHDLPHDLRRPPAERGEADVAIRAGQRVLLAVPISAVRLEAPIDDADGDLPAEGLRHADLARRLLPLRVQLRRMVRQPTP